MAKSEYRRMEDVFDKQIMLTPVYEASIDSKYQKSSNNPIFYGLPHTKQYPMPDEKHVRSAIRFFNYVSSDDEEELASNIIKMIKKYNITDLNVGPKNRFGKYYKGNESFMTQTSPIVPYQRAPLVKPAMETNGIVDRSNTGESDGKFDNKPQDEGDMKLHPVYFSLSYHLAGFGKFIKFMTQAPYSHCSLFFDSSLSKGYSFAGREGHSMIPYGLCNESMQKWTKHNPEARYALYVVFVDDHDFNAMKSKVREMYNRRTDFRYDVEGVVKAFFGLRSANDTKYFCSGFVAMILGQGAVKRYKTTYDNMKPMNMPDIYGAHLVDMGIAGNYDQKVVDKEVRRIYNKYYAKQFANDSKDNKSK